MTIGDGRGSELAGGGGGANEVEHKAVVDGACVNQHDGMCKDDGEFQVQVVAACVRGDVERLRHLHRSHPHWTRRFASAHPESLFCGLMGAVRYKRLAVVAELVAAWCVDTRHLLRHNSHLARVATELTLEAPGDADAVTILRFVMPTSPRESRPRRSRAVRHVWRSLRVADHVAYKRFFRRAPKITVRHWPPMQRKPCVQRVAADL